LGKNKKIIKFGENVEGYIIQVLNEREVRAAAGILFSGVMLMVSISLLSCSGMKNPNRPSPEENEPGSFITVRDSTKIFVYEFIPNSDFKRTIYIVSGITGVNHKSEKDIIELLSNKEDRVVVIHPPGEKESK